jgi:cyclopropane-fatty-acyl-phospholipid synthase
MQMMPAGPDRSTLDSVSAAATVRHGALYDAPAGRQVARSRGAFGTSMFRRMVLRRLADLSHGLLEIADDAGVARLGTASDLHARVTVNHPRLWRRLALGGSQAVWESYLDGDWDASDLTALVRVFSRNLHNMYAIDAGLGRLIRPASRAAAWLQRNTRAGSRRNIAAHYDLGNDFFELMLDPTMTYSCGVFEHGRATLEEASLAKIDRLCRRLQLTSGDHLLEIGTGWGGFALHAARNYGCRVTTTTLSQQQHALASDRIARTGLSDRVEVLLTDYRDLTGTYSKVVSVEMIEAVGAEFYGEFFEVCAARLAPGGIMALQAITVADQQFANTRKDSTDFIKRCVFPGSCIPSIAALLEAARDRSDFRLIHLDDLTEHYPRTLAAWRDNLRRHEREVHAMTTPRFRRMWDLYLSYCEGGFLERHTGLVHMVFTRPLWSV